MRSARSNRREKKKSAETPAWHANRNSTPAPLDFAFGEPTPSPQTASVKSQRRMPHRECGGVLVVQSAYTLAPVNHGTTGPLSHSVRWPPSVCGVQARESKAAATASGVYHSIQGSKPKSTLIRSYFSEETWRGSDRFERLVRCHELDAKLGTIGAGLPGSRTTLHQQIRKVKPWGGDLGDPDTTGDRRLVPG